MSYEIYKILHLFGLVLIFASLGALAVIPSERRKPFVIMNGIGATVILIAGFGLLARLGLARNMPVWVYVKMVIWLFLGTTPMFLRRKPNRAIEIFIASIALGALAAVLAVYKVGAEI